MRDPSLQLSIRNLGERSNYTFIPAEPKALYKRLLHVALTRDASRTGSNEREVLREESFDLLQICAERWQLLPSFRVTAYLEEVARRFVKQKASVLVVNDTIDALDEVSHEFPYGRWPWQDVSNFFVVKSPSH